MCEQEIDYYKKLDELERLLSQDDITQEERETILDNRGPFDLIKDSRFGIVLYKRNDNGDITQVLASRLEDDAVVVIARKFIYFDCCDRKKRQ